VEPTPEQVLYARTLEIGMYVGLACLLATFAVYLSGVMAPHIPLDDLSKHWDKSVHEYLHDANIEPGWSWITMLRRSDFLNFVGIATLAGVTVVCYLAILPTLLRNRDFVYAALALLEVLILAAAASGILAVGH
jgi:hypothetical protein